MFVHARLTLNCIFLLMAVFALISHDKWSQKTKIMYKVSELCIVLSIALLSIVDNLPTFVIVVYFLMLLFELECVNYEVGTLYKAANQNTDDSKSKS